MLLSFHNTCIFRCIFICITNYPYVLTDNQMASLCVYCFNSRCFETGIYCGFFRKNWEILFRDLIQAHGISEAVIIDIYNEWDTAASENHRLSANQGSKLSS